MNRRSFARALAIVALAPQLAFRTKPIKVVVPEPETRYLWQLDWSCLASPPGLYDFLLEQQRREEKAKA
jgi:hypothetical protein